MLPGTVATLDAMNCFPSSNLKGLLQSSYVTLDLS